METLVPKLCRGFKGYKLAFTVTFGYPAVSTVILLIFILKVTNRLGFYIQPVCWSFKHGSVKVNKPGGHVVMTSGSCQDLLKNV